MHLWVKFWSFLATQTLVFGCSSYSGPLTKFTWVMGAVNAGDGGVVLPLADDGHREADEHQQAQEAEDNPEKPKRAKRLKKYSWLDLML